MGKNFNETFTSELKNLAVGRVLEVKNLTKPQADELFSKYKDNYLVRGPYLEMNSGYILSFELNPYKIRGK